ncbi:Protein SUPPRESSOR OF npr1-1, CONSTITUTIVE 1 [Gossypium arboreum]|uniref:Protein SUPPRESSOR OF npr1-1, CONSTITUTIVE 1 n=1 Tax=Gossypium arboreum TaxID=29729 RepID=A0A0B0MDG2_GOSAR|nr:Protein SUPPRESSOR OF npr1-1, CONSTITUTIVE 1 [Gossypium arboreum]KHF97448.1 Protein SUPPRESSOR OF npr1-1, CONSTITUTIVE 1 [Gossypium arboreum]
METWNNFGMDISLVEVGNEGDSTDLVNLRQINFNGCVSLRKIPNLSRAINLEILDCSNCKSLVELPCLHHLASLHVDCLRLNGCYSLKKFPQVPRHFCCLDLSETGLEEVSLPFDPLCNLQHLEMSGSVVKNVSIKLESLLELNLNGCPKVELLSELPPYLKVLSVKDCTSLEKVSFAHQNLYQFDSLGDEGDDVFCMLFCNCFNLNQESTKNIEANAMLKIGSLAKEWEASYCRKYFLHNPQSLICCFPGNKISANKLKYRSLNSSLSSKISKNRGSRSRFLVFSICLVANLAFYRDVLRVRYICEYQLTAAGGGNGGSGCENFSSEISHFSLLELDKYMDYHMFILSSIDMVIEDKNYEEASFKFYIRLSDLGIGGKEYIKVERCGVHVFYVDKKSDTDATEKRVAGNKRPVVDLIQLHCLVSSIGAIWYLNTCCIFLQ